jgi:predicted PurR-regulated permease PerM
MTTSDSRTVRLPARSSASVPPFEPESAARDPRHTVLMWTVLALGLGTVLTLARLWVPLVLAVWFALLVRPLHASIARRVRGSSRAAGFVTVVLVLLVLAPLATIGLSLAASIADTVTKLQSTSDGREALSAFLSAESTHVGATPNDAQQVAELLQRHGTSALSAARTLFGAVTAVAVGAFVFVFGFYTFLVDGRRGYRWALEHSPLDPRAFARFAAAFEETGRGLLISFGLTALIQGGLATVGYLIIGVPQALVLGLVTAVGSFLPVVGTGLGWVPATFIMWASDRPGAAVAVVVLGLVVSVLDNFVRPALSRYGHLQMHTLLIFTAMLGGVAAFGGGGLLLGPLLVRMTLEGLRMWRDAEGRTPTEDG